MDHLLGAPLEELSVLSLTKPVEALLEGGIQGVVDDIRTANVALRGLVGQGERQNETFSMHNAHAQNTSSAAYPCACDVTSLAQTATFFSSTRHQPRRLTFPHPSCRQK